MMRRNSTSRRVHALSSVSIRSDEIAATDMALSRIWSRDGVSDIRMAACDRKKRLHQGTHDPSARQNQSGLKQVKAAVTKALQSARTGTGQIQPAVLGETITWRSNSGARSKCATRRGTRPPS